MLHANQEVASREVIADLVAKGEMFSAFDITKLVRQKLNSFVPHRNGVQDLVHTLYTSNDPVIPSDWNRSLHDFGSGATFIYHPNAIDFTTYDPNKHSGQNTNQSVTDTNDSPDDPEDDRSASDIGLDGRGRLCVPASLLRAIGLNRVGDKAVVFQCGTTIVLAPYSSLDICTLDASVGYAIYVVDKSNNVRISRKVFSSVFSCDFFRLNVDVTKQRIEIKGTGVLSGVVV
jgi:hypothetical protein